MRKLRDLFKKTRWKVIKFLFKKRLELERLMVIAHLMDPDKSLFRFEYRTKDEDSDIDKLIENYF